MKSCKIFNLVVHHKLKHTVGNTFYSKAIKPTNKRYNVAGLVWV